MINNQNKSGESDTRQCGLSLVCSRMCAYATPSTLPRGSPNASMPQAAIDAASRPS